jgi:hypothetical protein
MELSTHKGKCHCGAVRFEVRLPDKIEALECNCSICKMNGYIHIIVPASRFRLLEGNEVLSTYTFNTHKAKHRFCKICGIKSFYIPRSNPHGFSINLRCLDNSDFSEISVKKFDGHDPEENAPELKELT